MIVYKKWGAPGCTMSLRWQIDMSERTEMRPGQDGEQVLLERGCFLLIGVNILLVQR